MNKCLNSISNLNIIVSYIKYQEITILSLTNKSFYSILNPENNPYINSIFRDIAFKKYFNINNNKIVKFNNYLNLDDFKKTKKNWKNILKELHTNLKKYSNKEISEAIYKFFNEHYYMTYLRNENKIIEYENSTLHQMISYDINKKDSIISNHYDKYFDIKNEKYENTQIEPLKKGLFFEKELINLKSEINNYKNEQIIKFIINYKFEKLDNEYYENLSKNKNTKKGKKKYNSVIYFLVWLNHTFILFINLLYNYLYQFIDINDSKAIIREYSKIHSNLINFGLLVNENFNNINIIFNYLQKEEKELISINGKFNIYDMFLNIMKKNLYEKLRPVLDKNIEILWNQFYNEIFDEEKINNSFDSNNLETNNTELLNEDNSNDDNDISNIDENIEIEDDNNSIIEENNMSIKDIIEEYSNLILDYSLNRHNAILINNSKIKLDEFYNEYENLIIENFLKNIDNRSKAIDKDIFEDKNTIIDDKINYLNILFSFIKKLEIKAEEGNQIKLIRRTKLNLIKKSENFIFNYLNEINKIYNYNLNYLNIDNIINSINKEYTIDINNYSNFNNINYESYITKLNKLNEVKNNSENNENLNEQFKELPDQCLYSNKNRFIKISKEIVSFFYEQYFLNNYEDAKIIGVLFKNKDINNKYLEIK